MNTPIASLLTALIVACTGSPKDTGGDTMVPVPSEGPCADGGWGFVANPESAVHVRFDGDDENGTGSIGAPFLTLEAARNAVRESGAPGGIAVGPGEFESDLVLLSEIAGSEASDDGFTLEGCGVAETILHPEEDSEPLIQIQGAQDVRMAGFAMEGGNRALVILGGAQVSVASVSIDRSSRSGVVIAESDTVADLSDVHITDVQQSAMGTEEVAIGYGVSVLGATANLVDCSVSGSVSLGILVSGGNVSLTGVTVQETTANDEEKFGRGVQLEPSALGSTSAELVDCNLLDNADAGLFSLLTTSLLVEGLLVQGVSAALVGNSEGDTSGDGIVLTGVEDSSNGDEVPNLDPDWFHAEIIDSEFSGAARAGALFERVTVTVSGNTYSNNGIVASTGAHGFSQDGAVITGESLDAVEDLDTSIELAPLNLNRSLAGFANP